MDKAGKKHVHASWNMVVSMSSLMYDTKLSERIKGQEQIVVVRKVMLLGVDNGTKEKHSCHSERPAGY